VPVGPELDVQRRTLFGALTKTAGILCGILMQNRQNAISMCIAFKTGTPGQAGPAEPGTSVGIVDTGRHCGCGTTEAMMQNENRHTPPPDVTQKGGVAAPVRFVTGYRRLGKAFLRLVVIAGTLLIADADPAHAQEVTEAQNFQLERFRWSTDRLGILDVEGAEIPKHLSWDAGLWIGYAHNPLVLKEPGPDGLVSAGDLVGSRLGGSFTGAVSLFEWVQLGLELPLVLTQSRDPDAPGAVAPLSSLSSVGLGDLRIIPKVRILNQKEHEIGLSIIPAFTLPTNSSSGNYLGEDNPTFVPELAVSRSFEELRLGLNFGYRLRKEVRTVGLSVNDELFGRIGAGYRLDRFLPLPVEIDTSLAMATASDDPFGSGNRNYLEWLAGASVEALPHLIAYAGGGAGLVEGFGSPDWRVFLGVRVSFHRTDEDRDHDGILDDDDQCPDQPEDRDGHQDEDGCPDPDNDGDGILDADDRCPMDAGPKENEGCPIKAETEGDRDGDGVSDEFDNCPDEPGSAENQGCKIPQLVVITPTSLRLLDKIYFETGRHELLTISSPLLGNIAQVLLSHPEIEKLEIHGHTDDRGPRAFNQTLSDRRARAVLEALVASGVEENRLSSFGHGEDDPIATNQTALGRSQNRRVDFNIVQKPVEIPPNAQQVPFEQAKPSVEE
jgi:outer membrane protein OmpA-like peptidoglycan-associated protein